MQIFIGNPIVTFQQKEVARHLKECPGCNHHFKSIAADTRTLKPLSPVRTQSQNPTPRSVTPFSNLPLRSKWAFGLAASCSLILVFFWTTLSTNPLPLPTDAPSIGYKGDDFAMLLLRERNGQMRENPKKYLNGDRFRVFASCSKGQKLSWDAVLFQGNEVYFPYPHPVPLSCQNRAPLPGAFKLSGNKPVTVCLLPGAQTTARPLLTQEGRAALPKNSVCVELSPL